MNTNDMLFEVPEVLSPRLKWLSEWCIETHFNKHSCREDGGPWSAWFYPKGHTSPINYLGEEAGMEPMEQCGFVKFGNSKDEVLTKLFNEWEGSESYLTACNFKK